MSAAKFWRVVGVGVRENVPLSLTAFHLYTDAVRVDAGATLTCTAAPSAGNLADLQDTDLSTVVQWSRSKYAAFGFALAWEFPDAVDITQVKIGAGPSAANFLETFSLQSSADGKFWAHSVYDDLGGNTGVVYPGANALTGFVGGDPFWSQVVFASRFEGFPGPIGVQSCVDNRGRALNFVGGATLSTADSKFGTRSVRCIGSGRAPNYTEESGVLIPTFNKFAFGTGDFTVELFIKRIGTPVNLYVICDFRKINGPQGPQPTIYIKGDNTLAYYTDGADRFPTGLVTTTNWQHVALSRASGTTRLFLDGQLSGSFSDSIVYTGEEFVGLGKCTREPTEIGFNGYIDEFRVTKGLARYIDVFTPPAVPFDDSNTDQKVLTVCSFENIGTPTVVDECGNTVLAYGNCRLATVGGRSAAYLRGNAGVGLNVQIPSENHPLNLTAGDFTIDFLTWIVSSVVEQASLFDMGGGYLYSWSNIRIETVGSTAMTLALRSNQVGENRPDIAFYPVIPQCFPGLARWVHVALTRQGNIFRLWVAGKKVYEVSSAFPLHSSATNLSGMNIGSSGRDIRYAPAPSDGAEAYYDDFRVTRACRYTRDFEVNVENQISVLQGEAGFRAIALPPPLTTPFPIARASDQGPVVSRALGGVKTVRDMEFGGRGRIRGTVKVKGLTTNVPISRRVRLLRDRDGLLIREQWSNPVTGAYDFQYIDEMQTYSVSTYDYLHIYQAEIADNRTPELMS